MWVLGPKLKKILLYGTLVASVSLLFLLQHNSFSRRSNSPADIHPVSSQEASRAPDVLGVDVGDIQDSHMRRWHLHSQAGVLIKKVLSNSSAEEAGLQPADIIRGINHTRVNSVSDYQRVLQEAKNAGIMEVKIERSGAALEVAIPITPSGD